ncbi:C-type lectin domain and von Willebrand factor, type A domain and C-type lectin-like domain and C-type lectin fold domain-containing protein [Strongyloides ratti]|uniref:C-type lectin domain and von Willebrand factor, type A domain and C-type lectin-like domain and C-type lectin fold domain-containing protein n=1 Tax=Strongyloides ratti TaxID=34506 RepID=A0A090KSA7_STRRB|nr:C-type lectin domain and von Willebrand factor, type A domain and C-type lectin-like domain and C-type lectin fold domain-containing protein [Strongyloides ratti]CEF60400.1 C-type lectin domain and von Willebrand factor, type A domain and C-type lectin-like domain and C-type lectin fold domain-containing protein [Strongyloides ratti]
MLLLLKILSLIFFFKVSSVFTQNVKTTPSTSKCTLTSLDLVFVIDESGSIGKTNYEKSMNSIANMVNNSLTIGQSVSDSHVGMVLFNHLPHLLFDLNKYTSNGAVIQAIKNAPYSGGGTSIYLGLKYAIENVFGKDGDRASSPNVILLMTDGQDGSENLLKTLNFEATKKNISIYAIGVGKNYKYSELLAAAGNASRVFSAENYTSLENVLNSFCKNVQNNTPKPDDISDSSCSKNIKNLWVDMVFVVDTSKGVGKLGLLGIEGAIAGFVSTNFTIGRNNMRYSRAGIVSMGTSANIIANLDKYYNSLQFTDELFKIPFNNDEEPNIYDGLKKAETILNRSTGNPNRKQVIYLFSSKTNIECNSVVRSSSTDQDPCRLAASLKEKGITIVTFALKYDNNNNVNLMKDIGSNCFNFFNDETIIEDMITSALYVNCFCPQPLIQFKDDTKCLKTAECIYVHETPSTWNTAKIICPLDGKNATLANDFSQEKNEFLVQQLNTYNSYPYYIGLYLQAPGKFVWSSDTSLGNYKNWDVNEPNLKNGNCVQINSKGKWEMVSCNDFEHASNYICEEPACDADNFCS